MPITQKTEQEHLDEAQGNLLDQFQNKENLVLLLHGYIKEIAALEAVMFQLLEERLPISAAEGEQLDGIGQIVGEERQGRSDADYREALSTRINLNLSGGTVEDLIKMVQGVMGSGYTAQINDYYPAALEVVINEAVDASFDPTNLNNFLESARAAGVGLNLLYATSHAFTFDVGPGYDDGEYGGAI